jgi:hypothetical protein
MNDALVAAFITIGVLVVLVVIITVLSELDWDRIWDHIGIILFVYLPVPLMIYGVATGNIVLIILAEAAACIGSYKLSDCKLGLHTLLLIAPTVICLIYFIVLDQVIGAVVVTIIGFLQSAGAVSNN